MQSAGIYHTTYHVQMDWSIQRFILHFNVPRLVQVRIYYIIYYECESIMHVLNMRAELETGILINRF